jgi:transposase-like protein
MKTELKPKELNVVTLAREYSDEDKARELLEQLRWPNGPVCPHCANDGKAKKIYDLAPKAGSKSPARKGVRKCGACRKQFTVTVKTVFEASHIPISTWVMAMFIMCSSKKGVSSLQLSRMLDVTYKTAWFMSHRIRHCFSESWRSPKLTGDVEIDETFVGGKGEARSKFIRKTPLMALVQRDGQVKTATVPDVSTKSLRTVVTIMVDKAATLHTDEAAQYKHGFKDYAGQTMVNHGKYEYIRYEPNGAMAGVNSCESFFSLMKRGVMGAWHNVSREHLPRYAEEFAFRWNHRKISDGERMAQAALQLGGKRLTFRRLV